MASVLAVIIHYQTPDLLRAAVESFRSHDPETPLLVIDNGSADGSEHMVRQLPEESPGLRVRMLEQNIYHGPAMDLALREATDDCVFFLDSDTITRKPGFVDPMAKAAMSPDTLACGQVATVDRLGFAAERGIRVPVSAYMMINRRVYLGLPAFEHHGLPVLKTCREAQARGLAIAPFPVEEHVEHLGRGTAARFGYGLGLKSRLAYVLHRLGF